MICKQKATQAAETEALNPKPRPVYFISLVGVDKYGKVDDHEHIFDLYTKLYDFDGVNVKVLSAQDLLSFYQRQNQQQNIFQRMLRKTDIYSLVKFFIQSNPDGHFILDECPFIANSKFLLASHPK